VGALASEVAGNWVFVTTKDDRIYQGIVYRCSTREDEGQIVLGAPGVFVGGEFKELDGIKWLSLNMTEVRSVELIAEQTDMESKNFDTQTDP
jgi:hypothetical protein